MLRIADSPTTLLVDFLGCEKLEQVKTLRASDLGLKSIDCTLYNHLPALKELDISHNELEEIEVPTNPRIISLDCSHNNLKEVKFLCHFPGLKDLNITGNPLSIIERLIAACYCPNLRGVDSDIVEYAKEIDQSYEEKFWPKILDIWNTKFAQKYHPGCDAVEFAQLRQAFEKKLKESNIYLEPAYRKFEEYKISTLVTRLMIDVRQPKRSRKSESVLSDQLKQEKSNNIMAANKINRQNYTIKDFVKEMLEYEEQVLNAKNGSTPEKNCKVPTPCATPNKIVNGKIAENISDDFSEKISKSSADAPQTGNETLAPVNGLDFANHSKPIKLRFKNNINGSRDVHLIQEIYTSPRKLHIPLVRVEETGWMSHTPTKINPANPPKSNSPQVNGEKMVINESPVSNKEIRLSQLSPIIGSQTNSNDFQSPARKTRSASKNSSVKNEVVLPSENEIRSTTSSNKCPTKNVQNNLPVKRRLTLDDLSQEIVIHSTPHKKRQRAEREETNDLHSTPQKEKISKNCFNGEDMFSFEEETKSDKLEDPGMESLKNNLNSLIKNGENLDESIIVLPNEQIQLPKTKEWEVQTFLRCHSPKNIIEDSKTQVWRCVFEPSISNPGSTSLCVATCGGNTVCFTDCSTGKIKFKYKDKSVKEDFFAMDWTTIELENYQPVKANILAVGGSSGIVHLIHPSQLTCYSKMKCLSRVISCLMFHHTEPTILCCGGSEGEIVLWDIGIPNYPNYETEWRKLQVIEVKCDVLNVTFTHEFDLLLAGCEKGCYGWEMKTKGRIPLKSRLKFKHPSKENDDDDDDDDNVVVDSLVLLPNNIIATKCARHHCIYLWNLETTLLTSPSKKKSRSYDIQIIATLEWSKTNNFYINIGFTMECGYLACGDTEGQIWIYNIDKIIKKHKLSSSIYLPSNILEWPDCHIAIKDQIQKLTWKEVIINAVAFSSDGTYLVAATDKNIVCIWR